MEIGRGDYMNEVFLALDKEKQNRLINAAYSEFIKFGYKKASTNNIVKAAGIGKGMLFHYFNTKQELFNDLIEMSSDYVYDTFVSKISSEKMDFISRYEHIAELKMKALLANPNAFNLLGSLYVHGFENVPEKFVKIGMDMMKDRQKMMLENIDTSMFRKDIHEETVKDIIRWSIDGLSNEMITRFKGQNLEEVDYNPYMEKFETLLSTLRDLCYEKEEKDESIKG